jgi:hypothetical protein
MAGKKQCEDFKFMKLIAFDNKILPSDNQNQEVNPEQDCVVYGQ